MSIDPYSPCPCGSDKKVKFCCNDIVPEMQRILSLWKNNQLHMALQSLGKLRKSLKAGHSGEIWARVTELTILFEDNQLGAAKLAADEALEAFPDDAQVVVLAAMMTLMSDGYESSQALISRAFQESAAKYPTYAGSLATLLSEAFMRSRKMMAGREHLILALKFAIDPKPIIERLAAFDSNLALSYWLRTDYRLRATDVPEDLQATCDRAVELVDCGCFSLAAVAFEKLANKQPDSPDLWYNTALCLAWSGDERGAIEAFGESAQAEEDFEQAVECETLCQILELLDPEEGTKLSRTKFLVKSASKLLTVLEGHDRVVSIPLESEDQQEQTRQVGAYCVLDRPVLEADEIADLTIDHVPNIIAHLSVFDANSDFDVPAEAFLQCNGQHEPASIVSLIVEAAQGELEQEGETEPLAVLPIEVVKIRRNWYFPEEISLHVAHRLERDYWHYCVNELWPNLPLTALDGKTALEAVGDEEFRVELAAALSTFEAICDQQGALIDVEPLRERLEIPAPAPLPIDTVDETGLYDLTLPQLRRLTFADLSDEQLSHVMKRVAVAHVDALSYQVYKAVLERPGLLESEDANAIYSELVRQCKKQFRSEEALSWIEKGREYDQAQNLPLENLVVWDLREAMVRMWDPNDARGPELLKRLWEETGIKLPYLRKILEQIAESARIDPPWNGSDIQIAGVSDAVSGEVWTPNAEPAGEKSQLWVPGQD